ncbi:hypothetical protein L915_13115, partial [Phytophthora nicotianae]
VDRPGRSVGTRRRLRGDLETSQQEWDDERLQKNAKEGNNGELKKVESVTKALEGAEVTLLDMRVWFDWLLIHQAPIRKTYHSAYRKP